MTRLLFYSLCILLFFPLSSEASEAKRFGGALAHQLEVGEWDRLRQTAGDFGIDHLQNYIEWKYVSDSDSGAGFEDIAQFINRHPNWPLRERILRLAEDRLFEETHADETVRQWFRLHPPLSAKGQLAHAMSLPDNDPKIKILVQTAWIEGNFTRDEEKRILAGYGKFLTQYFHKERIERLLWDDRATQAEGLLHHVDKDLTSLYRARIALIRKERGVNKKINAVPAALKKDEGLRYNRMRWRHKKGLEGGALEILLSQPASRHHAGKWWQYRQRYARDAIEAKQYARAAKLLSAHGPLEGVDLSQALWLLGWVQLEYLNSPKPAYENFYRMFHAVKTPVSKARAAYWAARAAEDNQNRDIARGWYAQAGRHPTVFYGQLAFEHLHPRSNLPLPEQPGFSSAERKRFQRNELVQVILMLHTLGMDDQALPFIVTLAKNAKTTEEYALIADLTHELHWLYGRVKSAKLAIREHHLLIRSGWPVVKLPKGLPVEDALSHAIARQESEFKPDAVSRANARGLMQLLPKTAKLTAKNLGIPYHKAELFNPSYNITLGSQYLGELIGRFDGNYILAIAGYNAGPTRSKQWIKRFGTPGNNLRQTINWIETIPFKETRNYVQRVLENLQVYRQLLEQRNHRLTDDLGR